MKVPGTAILSWFLVLDLSTNSRHSWKHDTSNRKEPLQQHEEHLQLQTIFPVSLFHHSSRDRLHLAFERLSVTYVTAQGMRILTSHTPIAMNLITFSQFGLKK